MALHRFFLEHQSISRDRQGAGGDPFPLILTEDDLKHAEVLRLEIGEHIAVIDADADYFECKIASFDEVGNPEVLICGHLHAPQMPFSVTLVQALAKGDRFETVLKHATEVGVDRFIPISSERCVVRLDGKRAASKQDRWEAIIKNAAMQSGRHSIPVLEPVRSVPELVAELGTFDAVLLCWEEADISKSIRSALAEVLGKQDVSIALIVGPEGGLSEKEVNAMLAASDAVSLVSLGDYILRTETAGIVAPALAINELREGLPLHPFDEVSHGAQASCARY